MIIRRKKNNERGSAMIEFALSATVVIFLVFWMFEMIMVMYTYSTLTDAAKEGVRYAIVHGVNNPTTVDDVKSRVRTFASLSLHDITSMGVNVVYYKADGTASTDTGTGLAPPCRVAVSVSYPFVPYINLPWAKPTIYATAQGRIAY